ncbi:hypothetical protein CS8_048230 [Cupriavidus sp. 8B]
MVARNLGTAHNNAGISAAHDAQRQFGVQAAQFVNAAVNRRLDAGSASPLLDMTSERPTKPANVTFT